MSALEMKSVNDTPTANTRIGGKPDDVWMLDDEGRKKVLDEVCSEVVENFHSWKNSPQKRIAYTATQRGSWVWVVFFLSIVMP